MLSFEEVKNMHPHIWNMVQGLTGREEVVKAGHKNYCCLCSKRIIPNTDMIFMKKGKGQWSLHTNCAAAAMASSYYHVQEYVREAPRKSGPKKNVFTADQPSSCGYCSKTILVNDEYVKMDGRRSRYSMHLECYKKQKKVLSNRKHSINK